ncbi:hypothetical protein K469DRAFT_676716 [Zopfia rhizophila CBS 207.26]|uniref:Heterokaryon incompatibility domain-containing protein n=1 Tax=Zopfia rhizophila CBS 207.26 TaxID=1314779 RepID=A0A6A6DHK8_9PEZI|nr:hypothetical protein K469DRAFT_676716 [Zopfia rhizophila CBS 207.26]
MPFSSLFPRKPKASGHSVGSVSTSSTRVAASPNVSRNAVEKYTNKEPNTLHYGRDPDLDCEADYIPRTKEEAREHIDKIREEKGLDGTHSNTSDLENALKVLSEQLYQKSTHFLLELVQNADDNSYNVPTPTLDITYNSRRLRIDCNEVGFSKRNVAAICRVGQSSKSGLDNTRRYIGEKGIGFKSVFRVSDAVWIQSSCYSFKFDKNERLGMIAPIWTEFPEQSRRGYTSILLKLSRNCNVEELIHDVIALDPRLLIFLQKLKRVNVTIEEFGRSDRRTYLDRQDTLNDIANNYQIVTLHHRMTPLSYRIFRVPVRGLPPEPNRPDHTESEILLAFPIKDDGSPKIESQSVYAFLPIRDYGFKFLLQADFILIASREDIDSSSRWNNNLLSLIPSVFHGAIREFNKGDFRYSWLPYLPARPSVADFFQHLEKETMKILSKSPILESFAGVLTPPCELVYVPERLSDENLVPLILTPATSSVYVSCKYPSSDRYKLLQLGVTSMSIEKFITDLGAFITEYPDDFKSKPQRWHSRLAEVLISSIVGSKDHQDAVSALQIVPLRDGRWIASKDENLLFPSRSKPLVIPNGIDVVEIHPDAEEGHYRRQLFMTLGARDFRAEQICEIIIKTHEQASFEPSSLSRGDLISHAVFLYKSEWKNVDGRVIWVATEADSFCRSSEAYMDSDITYNATELFADSRYKFHFLHPDYLQAPQSTKAITDAESNSENWLKWLVQSMHVAQIPRMVTPTFRAPFSMSHDFQFLLDIWPSSTILLLMRHHWKYYSRWIVPRDSPKWKEAWNISQRQLKSKISSLAVKCRRDLIYPLHQTFLPLSSIQLESVVSVPLLDVPEPHLDDWDYLKYFGVVVELDALFWVECLRRAKDATPSIKRVSQLYEQLAMWVTRDNAAVIRRAFQIDKLVFIPGEHPEAGEWVDVDTCVWTGPPCLRTTPCLQRFYPEHQHFLQNDLKVSDANINTLVNEAKQINSSDTVEYIGEILTATSKFLELSGTHSSVEALIGCRIFPVVSKPSSSDFRLCSATPADVWFIADRPHLKVSFEGSVPLLAFGADVLENVQPLFNGLGLDGRVLSKVAKGLSKTDGKADLHPEYTRVIQEKARCIARLVSKESPNRRKTLRCLRKLEVYKSERVIIEWTVTTPNGETKYGSAESGLVASKPTAHGLKIFIAQDSTDIGPPPLELQEELAKLCDINSKENFALLLYVLMQQEPGSIEETLDRKGLSKEVPEFDDVKGPCDEPQAPAGVEERKQKPRHNHKFRFRAFRARCKPVHNEELSHEFDHFIQKVERVSLLQKKFDRPWGSTDASKLLLQICKFEALDANLLLPQGNPKYSGSVIEDPLTSLFDSKTGIWKASILNDETLHRLNTGDLDSSHFHALGTAVDLVDEEIQYVAELSVAQFLEANLGTEYSASEHWTSTLRSRSGYGPYYQRPTECCTFTLTNQQYSFSKLLAQLGYRHATSWTRHITYHIQVIASERELHSPFTLHPHLVKKAQEFSLRYVPRNDADVQINLFILILVQDIRGDPTMAMFIDPWEMHVQGNLDLLALSPYRASFKNSVSPINLPMAKKKQTLESQTNRGGIYPYRPLRNHGEIRLLGLLPGKNEMPLEGTIHHVSLENPGEFLALSYAWGTATKPFVLSTPDGNIPITLSLDSALRSIRDAESPTRIWADAICIDQETHLEKCIQIRLLRKIFQAAEGVVAWLGNGTDNSDRAITTLLQMQTISTKPDIWPESLPPIPLSWGGKNIPSSTDTVWRDIRMLLNREWFQRSWIVQELILGTNVTVLCGAWSLPWESFFGAIQLCRDALQSEHSSSSQREISLNDTDSAYALGLTRQSRMVLGDHIFARKYRLLELLELFSYTKATKECDKIFALLGLASDCKGEAFDPDYESSMETVVRRYAKEFVFKGCTMDLLSQAGLSKSYPFCSWIPFWTRQEFPKTISTWTSIRGHFSAGGTKLGKAQLKHNDPCVLELSGKWFDTIVRMSDKQPSEHDIITVVNSIHSAIDELKAYPTGESHRELKLKIPIGDAKRPHKESNLDLAQVVSGIDTESQDWPLKLEDKIPTVGVVQDFLTFCKKPKDARPVAWQYWETAAAFAKRLSNGTLCFTKKGYLGLVPGDARVGDEVCVFHGGATPFILRRNESKHGHVLIGEAYIHGIMHGEVMDYTHVRVKSFAVA